MSKETWQLQVVGIVLRRRTDGVQVAVPPGPYRMSRLDAEIYELCGDDELPFGLTRREVVKYIASNNLRSLSRPWP